MRAWVLVISGIGLVWSGTSAQARDPVRLKPSSPWNLHYADDSCLLGRSFGTGDQRIDLVLEQFQPGDHFVVRLYGKNLRPRRIAPLDGKLRFGPNEGESKFTAVLGTAGEDGVLFIDGSHRIAPLTPAEEQARDHARRRKVPFEPLPIGEAREAAATWLEISKVLRDDVVLETGPMGKPIAGLRQCSWDTVKRWGLDVDQQKQLSRKPHPKRDPTKWLVPSDYPDKMLKRGYQANVHYRLMVDEVGKPTSCHIQKSTRPKDFDDAVCAAVMKHAEFHPALDAAGKSVPSFWQQTVQFRMCC